MIIRLYDKDGSEIESFVSQCEDSGFKKIKRFSHQKDGSNYFHEYVLIHRCLASKTNMYVYDQTVDEWGIKQND